MSNKTLVALAAAGLIAIAGQAFAGLNGKVVPLTCSIGAKEFAGPVEVRNLTRGTIAAGKKITVVVITAHGKEYETITLTKALAPGKMVKGSKTYEDTGSCTASVFYPKA